MNLIKRAPVTAPATEEGLSLPPGGERILRRREAGERLGVSLRTVDLLAAQGILKKMKFPGRRRACGFRACDVSRLINQGVSP